MVTPPPSLSGARNRSKSASLEGSSLRVSAEFVESLEIDPVKECEMLWIAEEAFQAQLPPGFEEHIDEHAHVFFYNVATSQSSWQHPMDDLFKELAECWRRAQNIGGFWEAEDELKLIEDKIRQECNDEWMELHDEGGQKLFQNRQTGESRTVDPRLRLYHDLYARVAMVDRMKEKAPILAQARRPEAVRIGESQRQHNEVEDSCVGGEIAQVKSQQENQPFQFTLVNTVDEKMREVTPWTWQLAMHPVDESGQLCEPPYQTIDLFADVNRHQSHSSVAIGQRHQRTKDQYASGHRVVGNEPMDQDVTSIPNDRATNRAAASIQARVRGRAARCQHQLMEEERLCPLKGWFQYSGTGLNAARVEVQFLPNPRFDEAKYLKANAIPLDGIDSQQGTGNEDEAISLSRAGEARLQPEAGEGEAQPDASAQAVSAQLESPGLNGSSIADPIGNLAKRADFQLELTEEEQQAEGDAWAMAAKFLGSPSNSCDDRPESRRSDKVMPYHKDSWDGHEYAPGLSRIASHATCDDEWRGASKASRSASRMQEGLGSTSETNAHLLTQSNGFGQGSPLATASGTRKHYAGIYKDGQFIRTMKTRLEDFSDKEKAQVMADIAEERKRKVEDLKQRQKKHESKRRREQAREAKNIGRAPAGDIVLDEERKEKVRQLKRWLKKREEAEDAQQQELCSTGQLEQEHLEMRERRDRIAEQRRTALAMTMCALDTPHRMLHRHVHHHVHYRDGASSDGEGTPMGHSSSATDVRGYSFVQSMEVDKMGFSRSAGSHGKLAHARSWPAQPSKGGSAPLFQHSCSMPTLNVRRT